MSRTVADRRSPRAAHLIVFLTGFTCLVYEVGWFRILALTLGATVAASTIVLAAFMAGFGLGALFWGRIATTAARAGRLPGLMLIGIGITGGAASALFAPVSDAIPGGDAPVFIAAAILLAIPTFLMGGILPIVCRMVIASDEEIGPSLGRLYSLDALGSGLGGLAAGFLLLGNLGLSATLASAVAVNILAGIWILVRRPAAAGVAAEVPDAPATPAGSQPGTTTPGQPRRAQPAAAAAPVAKQTGGGRPWHALAATAVCGFAMIGLQVLWMRAFKVYFTNTSYTFALVSSVAILGLFAGSAIFRRRAPGPAELRRALARVILLMGAATALGLILLLRLPEWLLFPLAGGGDPFMRVLLVPLLASLAVVAPPAIASGYAFPLACRIYASHESRVGRDVGVALLANTTGSATGPLVAAFVLIPIAGAAWSVLAMASLLAAAALLLASGARAHRPRRPRAATPELAFAAALLVVTGATLAAGPEMRILPPSFIRFDREILYYRESVEGTLVVGRDRDTRTQARYSFVNNSAVIGASYDAIKAVRMIGHFPFFLGLDGGDVLVIGFGIGVTTSAIASHPEVRSIECVELLEGLREAAGLYRDMNRNVLADPRIRFIAGDGRHYLRRARGSFDLISCDPTHPVLGSGSLYTREYFEMCRSRLKPGGMVSQYLPLHNLRPEDFLGLLATFHSVFPDCGVWLGHYHAVLVGSTGPLSVDFGEWAARVDAKRPDRDTYIDPYHFAATLVLDGDAIARLGAGSRINTDDIAYTEFFAPGSLSEANLADNLRFLQENRVDPGRLYRGVTDPALLARYVAGNRLLTESLIQRLDGKEARSLALLREACEASPDDAELPFLIRLSY